MFRYTTMSLVLFLLESGVAAQQYSNSIAGTDFDIITAVDPTCLRKLSYQGVSKAEMPDKSSEAELFQQAHLFVASYTDKTSIQVAVDRSIQSAAAAKDEAMRYATRLGKLPSVLRVGVKRLVVHEGNEDTTAFSDVGLIVVYSANASKRISTNDLEETLFHESVHATWDKKYATSREWKRAQAADGSFATMYAKRKPALEDLAESALFAYAVIHHPERLPAEDRERIRRSIPGRIEFIERLIPVNEPIFFDMDKAEKQAGGKADHN